MLQYGMRYYEEDGCHVVELENSGEMDAMFDPFDPEDDKMPSHLYHRGHRYIKQAPYDWLVANIGPDGFPGGKWTIAEAGLRRKMFVFGQKDHAMLFKLTWHSGV